MKVEHLINTDATHYLKCSHCIGRSRRHYLMKCMVIKPTKSGLLKVLVFGERDWRGKEHIKKIRYVPEWRVMKIGQGREYDHKN